MSRLARLVLATTLLGLVVAVFGAYVRLSHAGLSCPDWPKCYGQITAPNTEQNIQAAEQLYPERPVEPQKAVKEMVHRYLAGTLGLFILAIAVISLMNRRRDKDSPVLLPLLLLGLVIFQALLGMWTVTLLVKPAVVTAHLLGGLATVGLSWLLFLRLTNTGLEGKSRTLSRLMVVGLIVVVCQIALGGWTSSNYAAWTCPGFPGCMPSNPWPDMSFSEAFVIWRGTGVNYEYGVLSAPARAAIQMTHRLGAVVTLLFIGTLAYLLIFRAAQGLRRYGIALVLALSLQILIGILTVVLGFAVPVAASHNLGAGLLLVAMITATRGAWVPAD